MRHLLATAVLLALPAAAQEPATVQRISTTSSGDQVKLVFECSRPPIFSVYSRKGPDRLVVELTDAQLGPSARSGGAPRGTNGLQVKDTDLSHVQAVLGLKYRVPASHIKTAVTGNQLTVTADLSYENEDSFKLTPGIEWRRVEQASPAGYVLWNELVFNPADPHVRVDVGLAKDRLDAREKPTSMIARTESVAGVNGGYFATAGGPLGLVVKEGKVLSPHVGRRPPRTVWGLMKDRSVEFAQVVAKGQSLMSRGAPTWSQVQLALGGGPRLLHRGQLALNTDEEELGPRGNDITRVTSRTALATTRDGKMIIATATGYHDNHMEGVRLETLAATLLRRGGVEAMNLDGGASTTMAIGSEVVSNGPGSPPLEKAVATTVLVGDDRPKCYPARLKLRVDDSRLAADGATGAQVVIEVADSTGKAVPDGTPVVVYAERLGLTEDRYKTKNGHVTVKLKSLRSPGKAWVQAECGAANGRANLTLEPGKAARVLARLTPGSLIYAQAPVTVASPAVLPSPADPESSPDPSPSSLPAPSPPSTYQRPVGQQAAVTVQVNDSWGNALQGAAVQVTDEAGQVLHTGSTGGNGQSSALLKLPLTGGRLTVTAEGLPPETLVVPPATLTN